MDNVQERKRDKRDKEGRGREGKRKDERATTGEGALRLGFQYQCSTMTKTQSKLPKTDRIITIV